MAYLTVTTAVDVVAPGDGQLSLREALTQANGSGGPVVQLAFYQQALAQRAGWRQAPSLAAQLVPGAPGGPGAGQAGGRSRP